ncbi:MAG: F0F1 ATP synthase subunit B [Prevotellaceae bacterium]|nr:F0F1 ATP synthase subunit B [Prevotellaceae bacterium]
MSLLMPDLGLLFWMLLSFGIVFFIVAKWGFPVITQMVEERKNYIDKSLRAADEVNRQLADVKIQSKKLLEETRTKQLAMLRETALSREDILADAKEVAQRETQKIVEEAQKQIRLEREAVITEIHSQVAIMAIDIAEKILRSELQEKERQMGLVNKMLDEIQRAKRN